MEHSHSGTEQRGKLLDGQHAKQVAATGQQLLHGNQTLFRDTIPPHLRRRFENQLLYGGSHAGYGRNT